MKIGFKLQIINQLLNQYRLVILTNDIFKKIYA